VFISVVVAVRDEQQYIQKCIESLLNQQYEEYEVIVVDGLSQDGTYEILKELQHTHDFILLRNERKNAAAGRNIGIREAQADFIAFIDGDAAAAPDWLANISQALQNTNAAGVGGPDLLPEDSIYKSQAIARVMASPMARGGKFNPSTQHTMEEKSHYVDHIPTCNLALRRHVIEEVGMFDESFVKGQDLELNYRIRQAGYQLYYTETIRVVHYRKQHIRKFARQIHKWAKAKVAIIKKHGMAGLLSHIVLWPAYMLLAVLFGLIIFTVFNLPMVFTILLFLGGVFYSLSIGLEATRLSLKYRDPVMFGYAALLLPSVHMSYASGILYALINRKIW